MLREVVREIKGVFGMLIAKYEDRLYGESWTTARVIWKRVKLQVVLRLVG